MQASKRAYTFWKFRSDAKFQLNLPRIVSDLGDYLQSKTSLKIYSKKRIWGMEAVEQLIDLFAESESIDSRYTRGIMEHKFFMQMRMKHLFERGYLKKESYCDLSAQIYKMAESARMLSLKYNLTGNQSLVPKICGTMHEMQRLEGEYLPAVLNDLLCFVEGKS